MGTKVSGIALSLLCIALAACGEADADGSPDPAIDGPYAMLFGAQQQVFSLAPPSAELTCSPRPGLGEFAVLATGLGADRQGALDLALRPFDPDQQSWAVEYQINDPNQTQIEVQLGGGYRYVFFQTLRTDSGQTLNSRCNIQLHGSQLAGGTEYQGAVSCTMLWADFGSPDYQTDKINNYVDLILLFECTV